MASSPACPAQTPHVLGPAYLRILPPSDASRSPLVTVERMPRRSRPARRATLVVHIVVSVGWFGLTLGLLILGLLALSITGYTSPAPPRWRPSPTAR